MSGYYYVEDLTGNRVDEKYQIDNPYDISLKNENGHFEFETTTEVINKETFEINYYNTAEFLILPYFNGRYMSEMTFTFDDVLETKNDDGSSKFVLLKRRITFKIGKICSINRYCRLYRKGASSW